ncbi:MAG TPA: histidine phosphatase family protein [Gammaproteobacteria bacterium]|nr:histidine phosphatase family protein [Gammaproteobacteria bacterium]
MKRTLILVRHAKSSWDGVDLPDTERPLADRGKREAPMMGKRLAKQQAKPDLILSSPARRALATAQIIAKELGYKTRDVVVDDRLYATDPETLLAVIGGLNDKLKCVMLFGHNPEFSELAHRLSGDIAVLPTCAVAQFTFESKSWANIGSVKAEKVVLDYPKKE